MKKAVFLDRDGTIIRDMIYLNDPSKIEVFKESYPALKKMRDSGFEIVLVTNQSGVARGFVEENILKEINQIIVQDFANRGIDIIDVYYCPHPVDGGCFCRKPNPGMLLDAAQKHSIDLKQSWMIGDRMTDCEAGKRAGCKSILLQNATTPPISSEFGAPEIISQDILTATDLILKSGN